MALFAPTFIYPDSRNGLGQGTIDAAQDLTVSWRVNGNSAMTAFQIVIYANDANSTQKYSTGQITDGCPFYGTTCTGEIQFFSYTISAATLSANGIANGEEYKLVITEWWSANDSVAQTSASAFITRATPTLSIPSIGKITTRNYTFTGNYAQAQGDVLNWFRWQIAYADTTDNPFFDTGEISGTMDICASYDGFFAETEYAVQLSVQTENGIEATTGWVTFSTEYSTPEVSGYVTAQCVQGRNAVLVEWSKIGVIPATASGSYTLSGGMLTLPTGSSVAWDEVNEAPMNLTPPWSVIWRGTLGNVDAQMVELGQSGRNLAISYSAATQSIELTSGGTVLASQSGIINQPTVTVLLTPTNLYIRSEYMAGGLYPALTLYPSTTLYPRADTVATADTYTLNVSYTQRAITSVSVGGSAVVDYIEVLRDAASQEVITAAITDGDYVAGQGADDYLLADFTDGLDASNLNTGGQTFQGYTLYRRQGSQNILQPVCDTTVGVTCAYDYAATSQQGPYVYFLFPRGSQTYVSEPLPSNAVSPCWWDWSLMECAAVTGEKNSFSVLSEFRFGKNVATSAMGNNNKPNVLKNFTAYPTVQLAPQNYKSGTLSSLIGSIDYTNGAEYTDTIDLMDRLYALSMSVNPLFLKDRKGRLMRVRLADEISMQTMDNTRQQAQTISLSWVESGSAAGVSLTVIGACEEADAS